MALHAGNTPYRARRVKWIDQSEGAPLAPDGVAFHDTDEKVRTILSADDLNGAFEHNHEWPPPPLPPWELSTRRTLSPTLQQTLPISPTARWGSSAEGMRKNQDVEQLDDTKPLNSNIIARDCHRETAQNVDHDATKTMITMFGLDEVPLVDDGLVAAPVYASSCALSPDWSQSARFRDKTTTRASVDSSTTLLAQRREGHALYQAQQGVSPLRGHRRAFSRSFSPETIPVPSRLRDGRPLCYTARRGQVAFSPSPLSPRPFAVFRSKKTEASITRVPFHSSTVVHEPRARCGCRGVTVQVDSGPLGFSLVSGYRIKGGIMLKRVWSDCDADSGAFRHSVEVHRVRGDRDHRDHVGALDVEFVGQSGSSGLIKIQTVGIQCVANTSIAEPPLPLRPGVVVGSPRPSKKARGVVLAAAGIQEVEEGDILVRVDHVQARSQYCSRTDNHLTAATAAATVAQYPRGG